MIMSEPLELQAQRPYALDQLTMLQSQIMQTIQGMVVLRARIEKQRRSNIRSCGRMLFTATPNTGASRSRG